MYESLLAAVAGNARLRADQITLIETLFAPRALKKGEFFQRAGSVPSRGGFVVRGCFRTYVIDAQGKEGILKFSPENAWIGDIESATTRTATPYFIEALESSDILTTDLASLEKMLDAVPEVARAYRLGLQRSRAGKERRIVAGLQMSAAERYRDFLERYPALARRVPQHMLASHLGMTPETLSRIRRRIEKP